MKFYDFTKKNIILNCGLSRFNCKKPYSICEKMSSIQTLISQFHFKIEKKIANAMETNQEKLLLYDY